MKDTKATFSERLYNLRKEKGVIQSDLANLLDISKPSYCKYESGVMYPSVENIVELTKFFNTTSDYLLGLSDNPIKPKITNDIEELVNNLYRFSTDESIELSIDGKKINSVERRLLYTALDHLKTMIAVIKEKEYK